MSLGFIIFERKHLLFDYQTLLDMANGYIKAKKVEIAGIQMPLESAGPLLQPSLDRHVQYST